MEISEAIWVAEMTSTSNKATIIVLALVLTTGITLANHGSQGSAYSTVHGQEFVLPEFDSQEEIITQFVAPFIFITIILQLTYARVLHAIYRDDQVPRGVPPTVDDKPDVSRYATLMAIATTAVMVPTPFWDFISLWISAVFGSIVMLFGLIILLGIIWAVLSG